jgi:hypothetical protein
LFQNWNWLSRFRNELSAGMGASEGKNFLVCPLLRVNAHEINQTYNRRPDPMLRERQQRNEQRYEGRNASCYGFVKESTGSAASGIVDHLRRRFARFKLCTHFL